MRKQRYISGHGQRYAKDKDAYWSLCSLFVQGVVLLAGICSMILVKFFTTVALDPLRRELPHWTNFSTILAIPNHLDLVCFIDFFFLLSLSALTLGQNKDLSLFPDRPSLPFRAWFIAHMPCQAWNRAFFAATSSQRPNVFHRRCDHE